MSSQRKNPNPIGCVKDKNTWVGGDLQIQLKQQVEDPDGYEIREGVEPPGK
jgi:hypothetical protein